MLIKSLERNKNWLKTSIAISVSNLANFLKPRVVDQDGQFKVIFFRILANLLENQILLQGICFEESSERTKIRIVSEVCETRCTGELALATRMRLSSEGANDAAIIIKDITTISPLSVANYLAAYKSSMEPRPTEMSGDEALVDFLDTKSTKQEYKDIRSSLRKKMSC